jgi:hypothetical protein
VNSQNIVSLYIFLAPLRHFSFRNELDSCLVSSVHILGCRAHPPCGAPPLLPRPNLCEPQAPSPVRPTSLFRVSKSEMKNSDYALVNVVVVSRGGVVPLIITILTATTPRSVPSITSLRQWRAVVTLCQDKSAARVLWK